MIRLVFLTFATLAGIFLIMAMFGGPGQRQPAAIATPAAEPATPAPEPEPVPEPAQAPVELVQPAAQTEEQVARFPGPDLVRSPEFAREEPEAPEDMLIGAEGAIMYVTASRVNMRAGPSTGAQVVTSLAGGTMVEALAPEQGGWINVRAPSGDLGYVSAQFLSSTPPG